MINISLIAKARSWLISIVFLFAAQYTQAQQALSQAEIEAQLQQRASIQRELGQLGQRSQMELSPAIALPTELQTNLPPMTESATDAAELLGTEYDPGEDAMFGQQLFQPGVEQTYGVGLNDEYEISIGDRVAIRMWGAFPYQEIQVVDTQGNVFVPNVGPIPLAGVSNRDLNGFVRAAIRNVFRDNVEVYATLEASQPVRVFVTGFVRAPGQYAGVSADSILGFLRRAGGIDPERGSYIDIRLMRGGEERAAFNFYDFLIEGRMDPVQIQDGDTIVVRSRHNTVRVSGDVFNRYGFEFKDSKISAQDLLRIARPKPSATHVSVVHKSGTQQFSDYHSVDKLEGIFLQSGDEVAVVTDRRVATILVRVDGAIDSSRVLTLPYGSTMKDALAQVTPKAEATPDAVQLFRNR